MIKVIFSGSYQAKMKRIKRLPLLLDDVISGLTKRDLLKINEIFKNGIKNNKLSLDKLADMTVKSKISKNYPKPSSPLYGKGEIEGDRSYSGMMIVKKMNNGWKLQPSEKRHWSKNISLKNLFKIHEHGAIIKKKTKTGMILIKIPPRPALLLSYQKYMIQKKRNQKEKSIAVKKAIANLINNGKDNKLNYWAEFNKRLNEKSKNLDL